MADTARFSRRLLAPPGRTPARGARLQSGLLLLAVLLISGLAAVATAQEEELGSLVTELEERFEVLRLRDGYALRPLAEEEFTVLELGPEGVAIDGESASPAELRELLGNGASRDVLALQRLLAAGPDEGRASEERRLAELERELARQVEARRDEAERERREHLEEVERSLREVETERRVVRNDSRVSFGSSLTIEEDESAREVVVILGSLEVRGEVRGDIVVIGGPIDIDGEVGGDVAAIGGAVSLGPRARVDGEVVSIGSSVYRNPSARVEGDVTEIAVGPAAAGAWTWAPWVLGPGSGWRLGGLIEPWAEGFRRIGNMVVLAGLVLLSIAVARRRVEGVARRVALEPWKAALAGLLTQVLAAPLLVLVSLLLVISIIGLPLAIILIPVSLVIIAVALLMGFAGVSLWAGRGLERRFGRSDLSPYLAALVGLLLIQGVTLVGTSIGWMGGPVRLLAILLLVVGFVVKYIAWTTGLGAVVLEAAAGRQPAPASLSPAIPPPGYVPPPPAPPWPPPPPSEESPVYPPELEEQGAAPELRPPPSEKEG